MVQTFQETVHHFQSPGHLKVHQVGLEGIDSSTGAHDNGHC